MPRYVILHHKTPSGFAKPSHFDLMLEDGDVLKTFTLWQFPSVAEVAQAEPDFDHRLAYLDYEGPVSRNRGEVTQADTGTFTWIVRESDRLEVELTGKHLQGTLRVEIHSEETGGAGSGSATSG